MLFFAPFNAATPKYYRTSLEDYDDSLSVVEIGYNRVPGGKLQIFQRDVYIIHYVISGKGTFMGCDFDETNGYIVASNELETIVSDEDDPYETYWISFRGTNAAEILSKCHLPKHNSIFKFNKNKECAKILKKALFDIDTDNPFTESCIMKSAFYEIMAIHSENTQDFSVETNFSPYILADYFKKNYNTQIKISDLAEKFHYTRNYMYYAFKKEFGVSPQEYLLDIRIKKAKQLLSKKDKKLSIKEIAFATGFEDSLYFSRIFKKRTGIPPTQFRK